MGPSLLGISNFITFFMAGLEDKDKTNQIYKS